MTTALFIAAALVFLPFGANPFLTPKFALLLAFFVAHALHSPKRNHIHTLWTLLLAYALISPGFDVEPAGYFRHLQFLIPPYLARRTAPAIDTHQIRRALALCAWPITGYLVIQKLGLDLFAWVEGAHAGGFFGNPNFSAHVLLLCLSFGKLEHARGRQLTHAVCVAGAVLCQSRAALIAMAILILIRAWRAYPSRRAVLVLFATLLAATPTLVLRNDLATGAHYLTHPHEYVSQYADQPHLIAQREAWFAGKRLSLMSRLILYGNSLSLLAEHPIRGVGLGRFHVTYPKHAAQFAVDINMSEHYRARSAHNLILDLAIQFGIPWTLVFLGLLFRAFKGADADWRLGAGLQLLVAMVSLNYQNPLILTTLALLHPAQRTFELDAPGWIKSLRPALLIPLFLFLDIRAAQPAPFLNPAAKAAQHYEAGELWFAWSLQRRAWLRDPYGPETLYNLAQTCLTYHPEGAYRRIAVDALEQCAAMFPFYPAAAERLRELGVAPPEPTRDLKLIEARHRALWQLVDDTYESE